MLLPTDAKLTAEVLRIKQPRNPSDPGSFQVVFQLTGNIAVFSQDLLQLKPGEKLNAKDCVTINYTNDGRVESVTKAILLPHH